MRTNPKIKDNINMKLFKFLTYHFLLPLILPFLILFLLYFSLGSPGSISLKQAWLQSSFLYLVVGFFTNIGSLSSPHEKQQNTTTKSKFNGEEKENHIALCTLLGIISVALFVCSFIVPNFIPFWIMITLSIVLIIILLSLLNSNPWVMHSSKSKEVNRDLGGPVESEIKKNVLGGGN